MLSSLWEPFMSDAINRPVILTAALLGLCACEPQQQRAAATAALAPGVEEPALWSIEVVAGGKAARHVDICADGAVRRGFTRPTPEVSGLPCVRTKPPLETAGSYSARCRADGHLYTVYSGTTGDLTRDFTVDMNVTRQGSKQPTYEQVRRYRLIGACPAGWHIGDTAAPGDEELLDTISGKRRPMPSAVG